MERATKRTYRLVIIATLLSTLSLAQIGQDKFVLEQLNNKENGFFIDIGSGHPIVINNTVVLEKDYGWDGLNFDYGPPHAHALKKVSMEEFLKLWYEERNTK